MWQYPDGHREIHPPKQIVVGEAVHTFSDYLRNYGREGLDALGYNECMTPPKAPAFTTYEFGEWQKRDDFMLERPVVSETVDETARLESMAEAIRSERDERLRLCDWTQLADAPLSEAEKADWQTYRQALRDVPQQAGFPEAVEWPAK